MTSTRPEIRARLAKVWTTPFDLDPARAPERDAAPLPRLLAKPRAKRTMTPESGQPAGIERIERTGYAR